NDNDNDEEFEFAIAHENSSSSCHDDHILSPQYPLFDTSLLLTVDPNLLKLVTVDINRTKSLVVRLPLIKLFNEDRDFVSSEADDDLEGLTPGTYCVWKPKTISQEKCSSGNSSRRWKLRDVLAILPSSQGLLGAFTTVVTASTSYCIGVFVVLIVAFTCDIVESGLVLRTIQRNSLDYLDK
ncbi:hypothetical protein Tco_1290705, partial [Tanacetum coccineum]